MTIQHWGKPITSRDPLHSHHANMPDDDCIECFPNKRDHLNLICATCGAHHTKPMYARGNTYYCSLDCIHVPPWRGK